VRWAGLGTSAFSRTFGKNRTILWHDSGKQGPGKLVAWVDILSTCSRVSKSEAGTALAVPGGGNFFAAGGRRTTGQADCLGRMRLTRRINRDDDVAAVALTSRLSGCCWCGI
jgi:hypothetical protein